MSGVCFLAGKSSVIIRMSDDIEMLDHNEVIVRAVNERLTGMAEEVVSASDTVSRIAKYLNELPSAISDSRAAGDLFNEIETALEFAQDYTTATQQAAPDIDRLLTAGLALQASYNRIAIILRVVIKNCEVGFSIKEAKKLSDQLFLIGRYAEAIAFNVQWIARIKADRSASPEVSADRMRRLRSRRKAGYRMVTVPAHKTDLEMLVQHGLLERDKIDDSAAIEDAVQAFTMMAFAIATRKPVSGMDRFAGPDTFERRSLWTERLSQFMETTFKKRGKAE